MSIIYLCESVYTQYTSVYTDTEVCTEDIQMCTDTQREREGGRWRSRCEASQQTRRAKRTSHASDPTCRQPSLHRDTTQASKEGWSASRQYGYIQQKRLSGTHLGAKRGVHECRTTHTGRKGLQLSATRINRRAPTSSQK